MSINYINWLEDLCLEMSMKVAEHSFDTCVLFSFFAKTLDPLIAKNGNTQVNNTNFGVLIAKLTYVPWQHE